MQLKLGHGYFKSYLKRRPDYETDRCNYNKSFIQSPAHLLLNCSNYIEACNKIREKLKISHSQLSLKLLLTTREEIEAVFSFLKETEIASRK